MTIRKCSSSSGSYIYQIHEMCSNYFFIETSGENDNGFITQSFKCIFRLRMYLHDELKSLHI